MALVRAQTAKAESETRQLNAQTKKLKVETRRAEIETKKLIAEAEQLPSQARKIDLENWNLELSLLCKFAVVGIAMGVIVAMFVLAIVDPSRLTNVGAEVLKSLSWLVRG
jgi:hypothetical protein